MMASMVANGNRDGRQGEALVLKGVDPETCMIVFKNHWAQVVKILEKHDPLRSNTSSNMAALGVIGLSSGGPMRFGGPIPGDEASAVQNYVEHMLFLLMEEDAGQAGAMGPILEFVVMENVMERLFLWSLRRQFTDDMKLEQLKMYEMIVGQARQPLLHHKPVLRPLMMLLSSCSGTAGPEVEAELVSLLNQLCCVLAKDQSVLELFFHTSEDQGAANFLIFSLLIPFIHREGLVGQQARDALLLIMSLSAENQRVAQHIAENTYFCPVRRGVCLYDTVVLLLLVSFTFCLTVPLPFSFSLFRFCPPPLSLLSLHLLCIHVIWMIVLPLTQCPINSLYQLPNKLISLTSLSQICLAYCMHNKPEWRCCMLNVRYLYAFDNVTSNTPIIIIKPCHHLDALAHQGNHLLLDGNSKITQPYGLGRFITYSSMEHAPWSMEHQSMEGENIIYICAINTTRIVHILDTLVSRIDTPGTGAEAPAQHICQHPFSDPPFPNNLSEYLKCQYQRQQIVAMAMRNNYLISRWTHDTRQVNIRKFSSFSDFSNLFQSLEAENWKERRPKGVLALGMTSEIYLLECVLRVGVVMLGTVSLALFQTLIGLYCEDVMLQLILRYLIPCNHMMLSQRRVVKERDFYSVSAAKILALTPSCCSPEHSPPPSDSWTPSSGQRVQTTVLTLAPWRPRSPFWRRMARATPASSALRSTWTSTTYTTFTTPAWASAAAPGPARCGQPPTMERTPLQRSTNPEAGARGRQAQTTTDPAPTNQLELEWDDSYDAGPVVSPEAATAESSRPPQPPAAEPPKHIQEMRRTAIMLVKGSYIEESDFQDDVMVYDLVAKKDARDTEDHFKVSSLQEKDEGSKEVKAHVADHNSNLQSPLATEVGDDLMDQYEELIRTLGSDEAGTGGSSPVKTVDKEFRNPVVTPMEEDEVDFSSFSVDTPELEKQHLSLFGTKLRSGSTRSHSVPFTGPFVSVLLSRLENMLDNSLHVNLLLTGILAQLAAYPQPLLQSFLLNTNMVFQPSVRSLYQVLASLKNQIEQQASTKKDFPELITSAQHCLLARESSLKGQGET
ncbi:unnamed protein product [Oncorhynchus mykiss]|uniref:FHF complex subunit HOOK-interacting protein C-terminal domain-containing protein n=1 Tax=Oncorhynchus mykiss TaxID=8022 RepID=A0A060YJX2_ONCMY|nr:unnamed protein product [Oncorhynchus mykiss]